MFLDVLDELAAKNVDAPTKTKTTDDIISIGEFKFSTKVSFEEQVNDALDGKLNRRNALFVSETPELLQKIGMKQLPMLYTQKHLRDAMKPKSDKNSHHHGLTKEQILKMPDIIKNPAIIMDSMSQENSVVVVSDVLDDYKAPIIMSIVANGMGIYELKNVKSNFISSYYGKDNGFESFIERALETDNILYLSKEKSQSLYQQTGLQLPGGFNKLGYDKIIHQSNNIVNNDSMQKSDKIFSAKRDSDYMTAVNNGDMETAQRMVDEAAKSAGYTFKLFHQTENDFTVFDTNHKGAGTGDYETPFGIFMKPTDSNIGLKGQKQMPLYAKIKNPLVVHNRESLMRELKDAETVTAVQDKIKEANSDYKSRVEQAGKDLQNYLIEYRKAHPDEPRSDIYKDKGFNEIYDREDSLIEEWTAAVDELALEAKTAITEYLKNNGYDGVIIEEDVGSFGRKTKTYIALDNTQVKSSDPVTYDNNGNVVPLSERFNEKQEDIRYATKRYWYPDMPKADFQHIRRVAKNELDTTENYLDNITKWLYNKKNGQTYFALYSTEYEFDPTILYASIGDQAVAEYSLVMSYLNELGDESDDGKTKTFNEILEDLKNTYNLRTVHRGVSSNRRNGNGNVSVYSGPPRSGISRALLICLQDSYERRNSVEDNRYSTKRELSISEEASNYILDTKEYQEVMKLVDERFKLTNSVKLDEKAVDRLAGRILKKSNSNFSREQLTSQLTALFDFIANSRELSWEDVTQTAASIAKDVLTESQTLDRSMQQEYAVHPKSAEGAAPMRRPLLNFAVTYFIPFS